jgi:hypothetical protein
MLHIAYITKIGRRYATKHPNGLAHVFLRVGGSNVTDSPLEEGPLVVSAAEEAVRFTLIPVGGLSKEENSRDRLVPAAFVVLGAASSERLKRSIFKRLAVGNSIVTISLGCLVCLFADQALLSRLDTVLAN